MAASSSPLRDAAEKATDHGGERRHDRSPDGGHVAVVDGGVRVTDWRTSTPEVVRFFEQRLDEDGDLATALELALKVGVTALSSVGVSVNVDYVDKEFQRLSGVMQRSLEQRMGELERAFEAVFAEDDGTLAQALGRYLGEGGHLAELFDPNRRDSAVSRIDAILAEHLEGEASTLHRLLDVTSGSSPLATWKTEIDGSLDRLRRQLEEYRKEVAEQQAATRAAQEARADEREKGTRKGRDYEELVFGAIGDIAAVFGDAAEPTGDVAGVGSGKVGDVVVTLNRRDTRGAEVRVAFEAKDTSVGLKPILRELDEAKDNRGAVAAVAVFSREAHLPAGCAPFREQGSGRFLALYDKEACDDLTLQVAYRLARYWAVAELAADDGEVDVAGIRDDLENARRLLANLSTAKSALTRMLSSVEGSVADVQGQLDGLRADLIEVLDRLDSRIRIEDR